MLVNIADWPSTHDRRPFSWYELFNTAREELFNTACDELFNTVRFERDYHFYAPQTKILEDRTKCWQLLFEVLFKDVSTLLGLHPFENHSKRCFERFVQPPKNLRLGSINFRDAVKGTVEILNGMELKGGHKLQSEVAMVTLRRYKRPGHGHQDSGDFVTLSKSFVWEA